MVITVIIAAAACVTAAAAAIIVFLTAGRKSSPEYADFYGTRFAHRGLYDNSPDKNRPENSLAAFALAVRCGLGVEFDIHLSRDGVPVVYHDDSLSRLCGIDKPIASFTADELHEIKILGTNQYIPRLSEVLGVIGGKVPIIAEFKCTPGGEYSVLELCEKAAPMLEEYGGSYCIESFNPYVVGWYKKNRPDVFRGQLSEKFSTKAGRRDRAALFMLSELLLNFVGRPDFVSYNCRDIYTFGFRLWRHIYGGAVSLWTVRDEGLMTSLCERGEADCCIFESFVPADIYLNGAGAAS
ncbi:MAG: glycerophosphodiester phosphodiesterase [Clostridiales bacterium]|nr:glycerophosphodiester phosphodiesterase [Clostridiales bacterium]